MQMRGLAVVLCAFLLLACAPQTGASSTPLLPTISPPTASPIPPTQAPVATVPPDATSTPVTPEGAYATEQAARDQTIVARATTSPFPTALAAMVKPGAPASASGARDGLSFDMQLPKDNYLAGEGGQAQLTLRNNGAEPLFIHGPGATFPGSQFADLVVIDDQGHEPEPYPWPPFNGPRPPHLQKISPGETLTATVKFQVPAKIANRTFFLWAWTRVSRVAPDNSDSPDNVWLRLEIGPIALHLSMPNQSQLLVPKLEADRTSWRLKVTDSKGKTPNGPLWGVLEAASSNSFQGKLLENDAQGEWLGSWQDLGDDSRIAVRGWVAAPGYVTAAITQMVPGTDNGKTMFDTMVATPPRVLTSLAAAQAELDFPLFKPAQMLPDMRLDHVELQITAYDNNRNTNVSQIYRMKDNNWLDLMQMNSTEKYEGAGWGRSRYDYEAERVTVSGGTGYLIRQFGWWILDWKTGEVGFELQGPTSVLSQADMLELANRVRP